MIVPPPTPVGGAPLVSVINNTSRNDVYRPTDVTRQQNLGKSNSNSITILLNPNAASFIPRPERRSERRPASAVANNRSASATVASVNRHAQPTTNTHRGTPQLPNHPYPRDCLDEHVERLTKLFLQSPSYHHFIKKVCGSSDIHPNVCNLNHPAAELLDYFRRVGAPAVISSAPWNAGQIPLR